MVYQYIPDDVFLANVSRICHVWLCPDSCWFLGCQAALVVTREGAAQKYRLVFWTAPVSSVLRVSLKTRRRSRCKVTCQPLTQVQSKDSGFYLVRELPGRLVLSSSFGL